MIETLLSDAAHFELFGDAPESAILPIEADIVAGATDERRREFCTVRYCARQALHKIGVPSVPILPDDDGDPQWPAGVSGSMTHCAGYRAAVVAHCQTLASIGIDAEPDVPLPPEMLELIGQREERIQLGILASSYPNQNWDRILFCAKEAVFKAWFPLTRLWLEFEDVTVSVHTDGTFRARVSALFYASDGQLDFSGRWAACAGLIIAVTQVSPTTACAITTKFPKDYRDGRASRTYF